MKELTKSMEKLPLIVKLILCIPFLDIVWSVWKLLKGIISGDVLKIILGILTIIPGAAIMWLPDIIWMLIYKRPFWFKD
ncbi:MAG: hypothetical protein K6F36_04800 [Bacilli bacterium]|nr:hypothetical protein [Bacilli bacterium]